MTVRADRGTGVSEAKGFNDTQRWVAWQLRGMMARADMESIRSGYRDSGYRTARSGVRESPCFTGKEVCGWEHGHGDRVASDEPGL